ncbi:MAG: AMIN domain-containing protein [Cyanobacteria bacterium J06632_22]
MERRFKFASLMAGGALAALAVQPAHAAATVIQGVALNPTEVGLALELTTKAGDTPQIFAASKGNMLQAEITNAQLDLPQGKSYRQANPAPGISSILLEATDDNTVRLTVNGATNAPVGTVNKQNDNLLISLDTSAAAAEDHGQTILPESIEVVPAIEIAQETSGEEVPDVLVPEPEIVIDGNPVPGPALTNAPPFLPRAVAPPVGDMAVSDVDAGLDVIDLGTAERVPRLVLRDAPAREVLSLLARAAGLNLAFTDASAEQTGAEVRVTLDIENEPVQNVFNYVLQISGLEANRVGRTVFVGPQLPQAARNVIVRSIRLNQVDISSAVNFLVAMGAESAISRERLVTSVNAVEVGEGADITESQTTTESRIENQRVEYQDANPLLRGLQVIGDERTNSLTLIGTPRQVEIATAQLTQLDLRRRQVAVNVRVIDVNLGALDAFGTSFSFGVGDQNFTSTGGIGVFNFGNTTPNGTSLLPTQVGTPVIGLPTGSSAFNLANQFLAQLQATVVNGQSKIVTDPTLVVQEGQTAAVQLTQEVVTNIETETETTAAGILTTVTFEKEDAGLNLQIQIERIDDNGFVTLSVAPTISAPTGTFTVPNGGTATLLAERQLSSGQIRVRDGQTLVLSGIIQESDRVEVTKVPILGDLPILGALFRSTRRENDRNELIVLLTPDILDDSDGSTYGYSYTPGEDVQELLEERQAP